MPNQADLRRQIIDALSPMAVVGGAPPQMVVPILEAGSARMPRIVDWQPLDALVDRLLAAADRAAVQPETEGEAELVCVDECGNCDACGMEPFGTPAEGWREAARFLRRTPRDSADFPGAIRGARLIEDELRRKAEDAQQNETADTNETEAPPVCEGFRWIGQSFAICDRCGQPAWEHVGEEIPVEGAGPFDNRRTVRPWEPGQADRIRAKWGTPADGEASRG